MSANISDWLLEDIDLNELESPSTPITPLATDDTYEAYYFDYGNYSDVYANAIYHDAYYNYYDYYDYYDYYNYSNSISVNRHPISQSVLVNETVTFSVGASNTIDSCQWYIADSPTSPGTLIPGATTPTLSFVATKNLDNKYYYCIVRRGGNSSTSNRASLTVMSIEAFDIYVNIGMTTQLFYLRANPPSTVITNVSLSDTSIASVNSDRVITGLSVGTTECLVTGSNGATTTFRIHVLPDTITDRLVVILSNTAVAIREYAGVTHTIYPNQMSNVLNGLSGYRNYEDLESIFTDIANFVRLKGNTTDTISPYDFYHRILSLKD